MLTSREFLYDSQCCHTRVVALNVRTRVKMASQAGLEPAIPSVLYSYPNNRRLAKQLVDKAAVWGLAKRCEELTTIRWI